MIGLILFFGVLVAAGTLVDIVVNILHLEDVFSENSIQMLQGFSLYSNTIKLFHCPETGREGSLDCIHGIRSSFTYDSEKQNYQVHFHGLGGSGAWLQHVQWANILLKLVGESKLFSLGTVSANGLSRKDNFQMYL